MANFFNSTPVQMRDVFAQVQVDLYEANLRWYTEEDIWASMQQGYNKLVALLRPIDKTTFIPNLSTPYYNLAAQIPDFMFVSAIYNPATLLWLQPQSYRIMKSLYQTYLAVGNPEYFNVADFRRLIIWPYLPAASGVLFVVYKAHAPKIYRPDPSGGDQYYISPDHTPYLPYSVALPLLEYFTMADLYEQAREFSKAKVWWDKALKETPKLGGTSLFDQAAKEIKDLARADHETVLEPYRWIFHGGASGNTMWINGETPQGTIDGTNPTFTLAQVPAPSSSLLLMKNGQCLFSGVGYTINGQTITYQTGYIPQPASAGDTTGDLIRAWYQIN